MKEQKKLIYIIVAIIIIVGAILAIVKGFNIDLCYSSRQEIVLVSEAEIDVKEIENIVKDTLNGRKIKVQEVDKFGKAVEITAGQISEEEKNDIINKVNEKYGISIANEEIQITDVPNTRIRDALKPYIIPSIITFVISVLYFVIVYHKIGLKKVLLKGICLPIASEFTYYSVIAITRIPFARVVNSIAMGIYILTILVLTEAFQKEKVKLLKNNKKENDK